MEKKPFEDIKVIDICKESLINRSTFYDHFNDKYELLNSFMNDLKEELLKHLNDSKNIEFNTVKEYFFIIVRELFNYINKNIDVYSILSIIKKNYNSVAYDMLFEAAHTAVCEGISKLFLHLENIFPLTLTQGNMHVYHFIDAENPNPRTIICNKKTRAVLFIFHI